MFTIATAFPPVLTKDTQKHLKNLIFKNKFLKQAKKGNKNLPKKQVTSSIMTAKPLPFSYCSKSNSRDHRDDSRYKSPNKISHSNSDPITVIVILNHRVETVHHTQGPSTLRTNLLITLITHILIILDHNPLTVIEMEIVQDDHSHAIDFAKYKTTITHS